MPDQTLHRAEHIEATPANMRRHPGLCALDRETGETFSSNANDYFWLQDNEPLVNESGEPLILAVRLRERYEPFVGEQS